MFTGAPYIAWIASKRRLSAALAAISAAVVGVILNLSIWCALHVPFTDMQRLGLGPVVVWWPDLGTLDVWALTLGGIAAVLLLVMKRSVLLTLGLCSILGMASSFVFTPFGLINSDFAEAFCPTAIALQCPLKTALLLHGFRGPVKPPRSGRRARSVHGL